MALGSVSNFWMGGRPSGLPENIEDQLANARRMQLVDPLEAKVEDKQSLRQSYVSLDNSLASLVNAAEAINTSDIFNARLASTSDETVASVQADDNALLGSGNLHVDNLATAHNLMVGVENTEVGKVDGIADPDDETLIGDGVSVSFNHLGESYTYSTTDNPTLSDLAQTINTDDNGVQASVTNQGTEENPSYIMLLKSEQTGAGNKQITNSTGDPGVDITGNLFLNTVGDGLTNEVENAQDGVDASFSLDGVGYTRSSNSVDDVLDGVSIELKGSGDTQIEVRKNSQSVVQGVSAFVQAYNNAQAFIDKSTDYDPEDDTSGNLMGSSLVNSVDTKMSRSIFEPVSGTSDSAYQYLSQVGVTFNRQGRLELDAAKLQEAVANDAQAVEKLFVGDEGAAGRLANNLTAYTDDRDGILTYKMDSIDSQIKDLNEDIDEAEEDVQNYLERMVTQFTAMENAVMKYQSVQDQLESIAESWKSKE